MHCMTRRHCYGSSVLYTGGGGGSSSGLIPYTDLTLAQLQAIVPVLGDTGYPTDSAYTLVCRVAGTWSYRYPNVGQDVTPTTAAAWPTTITPGGAPANWSVTDTAGQVVLSNWGNTNDRGIFRSLPAAPYTITIGLTPSIVAIDATFVFLVLRDSVGGSVKRWNLWEYGTGADGTSRVYNANSAWDFVSGLVTAIPATLDPARVTFYRVKDDNVNRYFQVSRDGGMTFKTVFSEGRTVHITPDQIGLALLSAGTSTTQELGASATVWHYAAT